MTQQSGSNERFELKRKGDILSADFINRVAAAVTRLSAAPRGADVMINSAGVFPRPSATAASTSKITTVAETAATATFSALIKAGLLQEDLDPAANAFTCPSTATLNVIGPDNVPSDPANLQSNVEVITVTNRYTEISTVVEGSLLMVIRHLDEWWPITADCGKTVASRAEIGGSATFGIAEAAIVAGGKTVIITLFGDTFVAAGTGPIGSTADTDAFIAAIVAATSPANGWNNVVVANAETTDMVRVSDTVATWTLDAEVSYDISSRETVTATVPAAVLTISTKDLTGIPVFTVDVD